MGCRTSCSRYTKSKLSDKDWALDVPAKADGKIELFDDHAIVRNGSIYAVVTDFGRISFYNEKDELLLKEYYRCWEYGTKDWKDLDTIIMQRAAARTYRAVGGDNYALSVRFEADDNEKLFGMGQYQQPQFEFKGLHTGARSEKYAGKCSLSCI